MFGNYTDIHAFLEAYVIKREQEQLQVVHSMPVEKQPAFIKALAFKDIVEITATILKRLPDDTAAPRHYQMNITVTGVIEFSAAVKDDILTSVQKKLPVFLAIRYGDSLGIIQPVKTGLSNKDKLHLRGQWITRQQAHANGGANMSVLHFTHHPAGFTCTSEQCYT